MSYTTQLICFSYSCSSQAEDVIKEVKYSNKILLPPSILHELIQGDYEMPYFFKIENIGDNINIELATPTDGSYVKLQPHTIKFCELEDPKALLEKALSNNYPIITEGHTIAIEDKTTEKVYHIDIVKTEPAPVIKIIDGASHD